MVSPLDQWTFALDTESASPMLIVLILAALVSGLVLMGEWSPEEPAMPGPIEADEEPGVIDRHPGWRT